MSQRVTVAALVAAVALVGCGSPDLSPEASRALSHEVAAAREAAEAGQPEVAASRLDRLREQVQRLREAGELSDERAEEVLAAAEQVDEALALLGTPERTETPELDADDDDNDDKDEDKKGEEDNGKDDDREGPPDGPPGQRGRDD